MKAWILLAYCLGSQIVLGSILGQIGHHDHHGQADERREARDGFPGPAPSGYLPPGAGDSVYDDYDDNQLSQYQSPSSRRQSSSGFSSRRSSPIRSSSRRQQFRSRISQPGAGQGRIDDRLTDYQETQNFRQNGNLNSRGQQNKNSNQASQRPSDQYGGPGSIGSRGGNRNQQQGRGRNEESHQGERHQSNGHSFSSGGQLGGTANQFQEEQYENNNQFGVRSNSANVNFSRNQQRGRNSDGFFNQGNPSDLDYESSFDPEQTRLCPGGSIEQCISVCPGTSARVYGGCVQGCGDRCEQGGQQGQQGGGQFGNGPETFGANKFSEQQSQYDQY